MTSTHSITKIPSIIKMKRLKTVIEAEIKDTLDGLCPEGLDCCCEVTVLPRHT
jgi:hypothetical protein